MSNATPGPWLYRPDERAYGIQSPYMVWTSKGPGFGTVATTNQPGLMPTNPEQQAADAALIASSPDLELMLWALTQGGWDVVKASLYDEEAVEGWMWTDATDTNYTIIGDWSELPPIDDRVREAMTAARLGKRADDNQRNKFVDFLDKILTEKNKETK